MTSAELCSCSTAATTRSCGRSGENGGQLQPTAPSGEFIANVARPAASFAHGVGNASPAPAVYEPSYSFSFAPSSRTLRPARV